MRSALSRLVAVLVFYGAVLSCAGQPSCGCEGMSPLPQQFPEERKVYDGIQARMTASAFDFITANFSLIIGTFVPGGLLFDVPSQHIEEGCIFGWCAVDTDLCPQGCVLSPTLSNIQLNRISPDTLQVNVTLDLNGILYLRGSPDCDIELHITGKQISVPVMFRIDGLTHYMFVEVVPPEISISSDDLDISGDWTCELADWDPVKDLIVGQLNDQLREQLDEELQDQLRDQMCLKCADAPGGCPAGSQCSGEFCDEGGRCVPAPLGMSGRIDIAQAMPDLPAENPGYMDIFVAAGQKEVNVGNDPIVAQNGLDLRLISGADTQPVPCVPASVPPPPVDPPPRVGFGDTFAPAPGGEQQPFMVGLGVSDTFMDNILWAVWGARALCIKVDTEMSGGILTSDALGLLLPSLRQLTRGKTSPILLVLRPQLPPTSQFGKGTLEPDPSDPQAPPVLKDPLIVINIKDFAIDFYGFIEERYAMLFTAIQDLSIQIGLEFTPDNKVVPIMGDMSDAVTNVRIENMEILGEESDALARTLPTLIGLALPYLTSALSAQEIPPLEGFKLTIKAAQGEYPVEGTDPQRYRFMAIYADLAIAQPALVAAETRGRIHSVEQAQDGEACVTIETEGGADLEYQFSVDKAGWTPFAKGRFIRLRNPLFRLLGKHEILARARYAGRYRTLDPTPERLEVTISACLQQAPPSPELPARQVPSGCSTAAAAGGLASCLILAALLFRRARRQDGRRDSRRF